MTSTVNRRNFLITAATLAAGTACLDGNDSSLPAAEPIERGGAARFKFSITGYSYQQLLSGNDPKLKLEDFIRDTAAAGFDAIDPTCYYFPKDADGAYYCALKSLAYRLGLSFSGLAVANDFCHPKGAKRDEQIAYLRHWIDQAVVLGAPAVRVYSGSVRNGQTSEQSHQFVVECLEESCAYAGQLGVFLTLENHGGLTAKVEDTLKIVRDVKSPWFGLLLDTGNFHSNDVYGDLAKAAPYALQMHVKLSTSGPNGKREPLDMPRVAKILRDVGFRGYVILEYEASGDPRQECPKILARMREAFSCPVP